MDAQKLAELKAHYGNVYEAQIKDQVFYFRELRRGEYEYLTKHLQEGVDVAVCQVTVVWPEEYDFEIKGRAGVTPALADEILYASGLSHPKQLEMMLEEKRREMHQFENQAEVFISQAFKNISFDEMKGWTQEELMSMLAKAEWALTNIWQLPVEFTYQEPEEDKQQEPPTLKEIAANIREQGQDPMIVLRDQIIEGNKKPFIDFPLIGGPRLLEKEEVLEDVRKQISKLPRR